MSPETRERISQDLRAICNDHAVVSRLAPTGQIVTFVPSPDFAAGIEEERARVAAIAKVLGIKPGHPS
jgi:tripartite-type tricarboxylate transporter receptor subunit TctC